MGDDVRLARRGSCGGLWWLVVVERKAHRDRGKKSRNFGRFAVFKQSDTACI